MSADSIAAIDVKRTSENSKQSRESLTVYFCVFSYNRGQFLKHCVASIEACVNKPNITIFDDNSNDPDTMATLAELAERFTVVTSTAATHAGGRVPKCGGLYGNMQRALDSADAGSVICCIQDDMQLVRKLDHKDFDAVTRFFEADEKAHFLQPAFMRATFQERDQKITEFHQLSGAYLRQPSGQSAGLHFSAVSMCHVDRLRTAEWEFEATEKLNDAKARYAGFSRLGLMRDPFMFYLPSVPAWRGKVKTIALTLGERLRRCGFYPYELMDERTVERFRSRPDSQLPVAEEWLSTTSGYPPPPWHFYPIEGSSLLKLMNRIELRLRGR